MESFTFSDYVLAFVSFALTAWILYTNYKTYKLRKLEAHLNATEIHESPAAVWPEPKEGFTRVQEEGIVFDIRVREAAGLEIPNIEVHVLKFESTSKYVSPLYDVYGRIEKTRAFSDADSALKKTFKLPLPKPANYSDDAQWLIDSSLTNRGFVYPNLWDQLDELQTDPRLIQRNTTSGFNYLFETSLLDGEHFDMFLLAPGGVFNMAIDRAVTHFYYCVNVTLEPWCLGATEIKPEHRADTKHRSYTFPSGYLRNFSHRVEMPSMTREVIGEMLSKDMANIPYYGSFFHDQGYLSIQVDMDNTTYLFSRVEGHRLSLDQSLGIFADAKPSILLATLIDLRTRRDPKLVKTDYGYTFTSDGVTVHWYV